MEIWGTVALFVLGIVLTVKGGDLFVPMASSETYTSLQQGIVDGAENTELALTVEMCIRDRMICRITLYIPLMKGWI